MKKQAVKSVASFAVVLIILSIVPSGAFALENGTSKNQANTTNENEFGKMVPGGMRHGGAGHEGMCGMGTGPAENITEENFADIQAEMLDSITEKIAELQSTYSNVSEASDASELQAVLSSQKPENGGRPDGRNMGPGGTNQGRGVIPGLFGFAQVESVTDDNYTEVQAEMVDLLGNMTEMLNGQLDNTTDENMTEMLNEQITELETLSTEISAASSATELQDVVFTYMQTQAVESLEMELEHLEEMASESENTTDDNMTENFSSRITELTALIEEINGAESLEDLVEIMSSSQRTPGMGFGGPMQKGGCGNIPMRPESIQDNSMDNSTEV